MTSATSAFPQPSHAQPPSRLFALTEPRALFELAAFYMVRPYLSSLPQGDGHPVLVLPGFLASDTSTAPLRGLLKQLGFDARGWGMGRNVRIDAPRVHEMESMLLRLYRETGRKVSIIGWSLGGVFARELAKMHPDAVRLVISLGSPISDDRRHSNAARLFEYLNGKDPEPIRQGRFTDLHRAPPVPTTSILTRSDGVVHWRGSVQRRENHTPTENIEVLASHMGLGFNPSAVIAIVDRLLQPEGTWKPFVPRISQRWMFPQGNLH